MILCSNQCICCVSRRTLADNSIHNKCHNGDIGKIPLEIQYACARYISMHIAKYIYIYTKSRPANSWYSFKFALAHNLN